MRFSVAFLTSAGLIFSFISMVWVFSINTAYIKLSQPIFLYLICIGCIVSLCAILTSLVDDRGHEEVDT